MSYLYNFFYYCLWRIVADNVSIDNFCESHYFSWVLLADRESNEATQTPSEVMDGMNYRFLYLRSQMVKPWCVFSGGHSCFVRSSLIVRWDDTNCYTSRAVGTWLVLAQIITGYVCVTCGQMRCQCLYWAPFRTYHTYLTAHLSESSMSTVYLSNSAGRILPFIWRHQHVVGLYWLFWIQFSLIRGRPESHIAGLQRLFNLQWRPSLRAFALKLVLLSLRWCCVYVPLVWSTLTRIYLVLVVILCCYLSPSTFNAIWNSINQVPQ